MIPTNHSCGVFILLKARPSVSISVNAPKTLTLPRRPLNYQPSMGTRACGLVVSLHRLRYQVSAPPTRRQ